MGYVVGDAVARHVLVRKWASFTGISIWDGHDEGSKKPRTVVILEPVGALPDGSEQWAVRPEQFARGIAFRKEFEAYGELPDGDLPKTWRRLHAVAADQRAYVTDRLEAEPLESVSKLSMKRKVALSAQLEQLVGYFNARGYSASGLDASNLAVARNVDAFVVLDLSFMRRLDETTATTGGVEAPPRTRRYLAPEVLYDNAVPTPRSDVVTVARIMQHLFSEKPPEPTFPTQVVLEGCSSRFAGPALAHALALDPLSRPATVAELFAEIRGKRAIPRPKGSRSRRSLEDDVRRGTCRVARIDRCGDHRVHGMRD